MRAALFSFFAILIALGGATAPASALEWPGETRACVQSQGLAVSLGLVTESSAQRRRPAFRPGGGLRPSFRPGRPGFRPGLNRPGRPGFRPGRPNRPTVLPSYRPNRPGFRPNRPGFRPGWRPGRPAYVRRWIRRAYYGRVVAGVVLGTIAVVAIAGQAPASVDGLCWYWTDGQRTRGYWDYCE